MASIVMHIVVGLLFWPIAVPFAAILGLLYSFYPISLVNGFLRFGGYITIPGFKSKSIKARGIDISYLDTNPDAKSQPVVVFIHGFTSQKLGFVPMIRSLPKSWRVIAFDLPGHGQSSFREDVKYCADEIGAIIHEFFCKLDLHNIHLIGESIGAVLAGHYAHRHIDMLRSLTLICPPGPHRLEGAMTTPIMELIDNDHGDDVKNPLLPTTADEFREMLKIVLHNPEPYYCHDKMLSAIVRVQSKHYHNFKKFLNDLRHGGETPEEIRRRMRYTAGTSLPSMVIWGRDDKVCHISGARIIKQKSPKTKVYVLNNCGHCVSVEKPGKCVQFIERFIQNQLQTR